MSDASVMIRDLAEPWGAGEKLKDALERTMRLTKFAYWRSFDIYYDKARKIEEHEIEKLKEALRIKNEKAARNELHDLKFRIARLEATLSASRDADFHSPDVDFARELLRSPGGMGGTVGRRR